MSRSSCVLPSRLGAPSSLPRRHDGGTGPISISISHFPFPIPRLDLSLPSSAISPSLSNSYGAIPPCPPVLYGRVCGCITPGTDRTCLLGAISSADRPGPRGSSTVTQATRGGAMPMLPSQCRVQPRAHTYEVRGSKSRRAR
jgi:hypothetical protein